jgi:hypothetical protein
MLGCLLLAGAAFSQTYDVVGVVIDSEKGEPIGSARIELRSGKLLGYSKSNGRFEITVNSSSAVLVFKRVSYKDQEVDLSDFAELIDLEISMESDVIELAEKDTTVRRNLVRDPFGPKTLEELEQVQGMRIDLNDHLRQLPGVSGMGEFTNDISIWGSRTHDVTHYLGQSRIPSIRHLDFGFPGNQSVINPRLLRSVTVADNLAKGPLNQGNSSALVYDLKEGDPNNIRGDLVFGTVNRELNLAGYWEGRTFLFSGRYLEPTFLANMGEKFFTEAKDARLGNNGQRCDSTRTCRDLKDAFDFRSGDLYAGTFYRDSTGAMGRHSFILVEDEYEVKQDVGRSLEEAVAQTLVNGTQNARMYVYEGLSPFQTGDLSYALSLLSRNREEAFRDTLPPSDDDRGRPWFPRQSGNVDHLLGQYDNEEIQATVSFQWNSAERILGARYGYGLDLEWLTQDRTFRDIDMIRNAERDVLQDYALANGLFRLRWSLPAKSHLDAAAGAAFVYQGLFNGGDGDNAGLKTPAPLASLRYTRPLTDKVSAYGETALRQNTALEPTGLNRIDAVTTSSVEGKVGTMGSLPGDLEFTASLYSRVYKDPTLPVPEVFWNYEDAQRSDYAYVSGANLTFGWAPSHHFGMGLNASVVQGDYHLEEGGHLPWEANRTLDLVTNMRFLPRSDSLLSLIVTYTANNGAPLYEYEGLWDGATTLQRRAIPSSRFETVSRQRTDARINLDIPSRWRPLSNFRFFFEADNIFADAESAWFSWLGGANERKRGWTRANSTGNLEPIVTKGMGLFLVFGFEGKLAI